MIFMKPAKSILLSFLLGVIVSAEEAQSTNGASDDTPVHSLDPAPVLVQPDPRPSPEVVLRFTQGNKPASGDQHAYVIIAWANPRAGSDLRGYQFWGDDRMLESKEIEFVLEAVLKERPRNVFVLGNNWAAGSELDPVLQKLSKRHQIDVFGGSTISFNKVDFRDEPAEVKRLITKIITQSREAQEAMPPDGAKPPN